ncbi:MAG: GGDEF domain-containing protein [Cyanobacteria bacterium P01_A01_bin.45]
MNISICVFGNDDFLATLPKEIHDTDAFSVEVFNNLNETVSRVEIQPPDIILIQASQDESTQLCNWLGEQAKLKESVKLFGLYCIFLEDRPQLLAARNNYNYEWEQDITSAALRQGADAYIWYYPNSQETTQETTASDRLLLSQLMVGVRKAQKYRELIRTNDILSAIALADSLTGLSNRRALEWDLPRKIEKARVSETELSLIILDVDYFKKINDTYGHLVGDRLLQLMCKRLRHNLRPQDTPFRYGGEEFVVILSNTNGEEVFKVANRLRKLIGEQPFSIDTNLSINVTISLGAACLESDDDANGISLLNRADQYLLKAKSSGRDRVVCEDIQTSYSHPQTKSLSQSSHVLSQIAISS